MKVRIGTENIAMAKHRRILVLVIVKRNNWNKHIQDAKEKADKKLNLTKFLTIHQMIIVSTLMYGETACGSASKAVLSKLDSIHHRGVRLALGTFAGSVQNRKRAMRSGISNKRPELEY
jgi:hypothetical protein